MNLGQELWSEYLDKFCPATEKPELDRLRPEQVVKLLWPLNDVFRTRSILLQQQPSLHAFDGEADDALRALARTNEFKSWETISAGAWATLIDRHTWGITALMLEEANPKAFSVPVPRHVSDSIKQTATLLLVLGGPARNPPDHWRKRDKTQPFSLSSALRPN